MVRESWYYEGKLKELGILILERIFKGHIITIQKYSRCPWLKGVKLMGGCC